MIRILSSRHAAIAAIAGSVGVIVGLQLLSGGAGAGGGFTTDYHLSLLHEVQSAVYSPGINAPYAPYKGEIEPPSSQRQLGRQLKKGTPPWRPLERSAYVKQMNGTVTCTFGQTLGPTEIPEDASFENTIVVGYPGADKRIVVRQMEAMTSLSGRDAWDNAMLGHTRQPFVKTNYPHHEGIWGAEDRGGKVILIVRNIRHNMDGYHDILADIDYAKTWEEATEKIPTLYHGEIIHRSFTRWRDERIMDEIGWYGWLIDYWMEGGILRDYFDHKLTDKAHWAKLRAPETWTYGELQWDVNHCETDPMPAIEYDGVCDPQVTDCKATVIISPERLLDPATGHAENRKVATLLNQTGGVSDFLLDEPAWDCLYDLIIGCNPTCEAPDRLGTYHDYRAREGVATRKHVMSTRHLNKMARQLTRLINKYGAFDAETGIDWANNEQAQYLVELLTEHRTEVQAEVDSTAFGQNWAHPPKPNWVIAPNCSADRGVWDFNYPGDYSGLVADMFPDNL